MTDQIALCRKAESLCYRLAPQDLADTPLYVVAQSQLPVERGGLSRCDGFTSPSLDLYLRDVIVSAWRGRGPCMVIKDIALIGDMDEQDVESAFFGIVLHELGHILGRSRLYFDRDETDQTTISAEAADMARQVVTPIKSDLRLIPFLGHGARFLRGVLHLCHRAQVAGIPMSPNMIFNGTGYCLSRTNQYRTALGAEPRRQAHASMREILDTPYPKAFWRLWTTDVAQWLTHCSPELERSFAWF